MESLILVEVGVMKVRACLFLVHTLKPREHSAGKGDLWECEWKSRYLGSAWQEWVYFCWRVRIKLWVCGILWKWWLCSDEGKANFKSPYILVIGRNVSTILGNIHSRKTSLRSCFVLRSFHFFSCLKFVFPLRSFLYGMRSKRVALRPVT